MATSGSKSVKVTDYDTLKFSWSLSSQSVSDNYSKVSWKLQLISRSAGAIYSSASKKWSVKINGKSYSGSNTIGIGNNSTKTLASGSTTINHNSDGKKTFSYSFSQTFDITFNGSHVGTKSGSGSGTLTTIPRASSMSVPNITIGSSGTLSISRASSSFTHTITCTFGSYSKTIVSKGTGSSYRFTPPLDWCKAIPNDTSGTVTYKITTYSGSTSIGSKSYSKTLYVPSSVVPSISSVTHAEISLSSGWAGIYVKTKSKIQFRISSAGAYDSTIKSIVTKFDGQTLSGTPSSSATCYTAGSVPYTVTVTDSRGRTASKSGTISVLNYVLPTLSIFSAFRCDENGKPDDDGEKLSIKKAYSITPLNNINTNKWDIKYRESGASSWSTLTSGTGYSVNDIWISDSIFNVDKTYELQINVSDSFHIITKTIPIPTAFTLIDYHKSGNALAFGRVSSGNNFESALNIILDNNKCIYSRNTSGDIREILSLSTNNNIIVGYGSYLHTEASTYIYGNNVALYAKNPVKISSGTNNMVLGYNNELNFGVTGTTTLFFGCRNVGNSVPQSYRFCTGTAKPNATIYCGDIIIPASANAYRSQASDGTIFNLIYLTDADNVSIGGGGSPPKTIYIRSKDRTSDDQFAVGTDNVGDRIWSMSTYNRTYSSGSNMYITSLGTFGRNASSSKKYKKDIVSIEENLHRQRPMLMSADEIEPEPIINPENLYDIPVMQYKYIDGYLAGDDDHVGKDVIGIMAEDIAEKYPAAAILDESGQPESWNKDAVLVGLLYLVQQQKKELEDLKGKLK